VPHTADAGLLAIAPTLPLLFEEVAAALAELSADVAPGVAPSAWEAIDLEAADLPGLAYEWLNELIALGELHRGVVVEAIVERIDEPGATVAGAPWRLRGRVGIAPYSPGGARPRRHVKSATFHRLEAGRRGGRWAMQAYLDI
jgi:SHS2 domain-containing protein